jgi:uncharacterized membrane protein YtjA (UPF0391 family)
MFADADGKKCHAARASAYASARLATRTGRNLRKMRTAARHRACFTLSKGRPLRRRHTRPLAAKYTNPRRHSMLRWALIFFVIALVAALFGFGGIAGLAADVAQILFFGFLLLAAVVLVLGLAGGRGVARRWF